MTKKGTPKAGKVKEDNPEQSRRFVETARELGADEGEGIFEQSVEAVIKKPASEKAS